MCPCPPRVPSSKGTEFSPLPRAAFVTIWENWEYWDQARRSLLLFDWFIFCLRCCTTNFIVLFAWNFAVCHAQYVPPRFSYLKKLKGLTQIPHERGLKIRGKNCLKSNDSAIRIWKVVAHILESSKWWSACSMPRVWWQRTRGKRALRGGTEKLLSNRSKGGRSLGQRNRKLEQNTIPFVTFIVQLYVYFDFNNLCKWIHFYRCDC